MNDDNENDSDLHSILRELMLTVTAQMLAMKASHLALVSTVLKDLDTRGAIPVGYPDLYSAFQAQVARKCDEVLADYADTNPSIASEVKRLLDDMKP